MLRLAFLALTTALTFLAALPYVFAQGTDIIGDGGFESGSIGLPVAGQPPVYGEWVADQPGSATDTATVEAVGSPVLEGDYAGQVDTRTAQSGRFIYQDVETGTGCFTWTFHVYRDEGISTAELLQDWDRGVGNALFVSALTFDDTRIVFTGWGAAQTIAEPLSTGDWHEVVVEADGDNATQTLSIDGEQLAEVTAAASDTVVETIILGDVSGVADHGLYTYDNVSIEARECEGAPAQATSSAGATPTPAPATSADEDGGGFPWWLVIVIIIVAGGLFLFLWWRRRRRPEDDSRS